MKFNSEQIKSDIILVIAFMTLLFTVCTVFYSDLFTRDDDIKVNKNIKTDEALAKKLQKQIPYQDITNIKYSTAYQDKSVSVTNIHNDILLTTAYQMMDTNDTITKDQLFNQVRNMYGNNLFMITNSFNVNGINSCLYDKSTDTFSCSLNNYNGIIYRNKRVITNLKIQNDITELSEKNLFYSVEKINDTTYYKIYSNGTFKTPVVAFTNVELESSLVSLDQYLEKYQDYCVNYKSTFKNDNGNYIWTGTGIE